MYFFLCFCLQLVFGDDCGWSIEYVEWSDDVCASVEEAYTNENDEIVVAAFDQDVAHLVKINEANIDVSMMISSTIDSSAAEGKFDWAEVVLEYTKKSANPIMDYSGIDGNTKNFCNGIKFTAEYGVKMTAGGVGASMFNGANSVPKAVLEVFMSANNAGHVLTINGVIESRKKFRSSVLEGYFSSVELPYGVAPQTTFISLYVFSTVVDRLNDQFWLYASPVSYSSVEDLKLSEHEYSFLLPPLSGLQQRFFSMDKFSEKARMKEIQGDPLKPLNTFTRDAVCPTVSLVRPVFDPILIDVTFYNNNFNEEITLRDVPLESVVNIRVRAFSSQSSVVVQAGADCNRDKGAFLELMSKVGIDEHMAVDKCGLPEIMPVFVKYAIPMCYDTTGDCSAAKPRTGAFGYCFGPVPFSYAENLCDARNMRIPLYRDADNCCTPDSCTNGRQLFWVDGFTGSFTTQALKLPDFFPYLIRNDFNNVHLIESVGTWFNDGNEVPLADPWFTDQFYLLRDQYLDLQLKGLPEDCISLDIFFQYVKTSSNALYYYTLPLPFRTVMGVFVTVYDVSDGEHVVDRGFSIQAINYYAGPEMSSPNFGTTIAQSRTPNWAETWLVGSPTLSAVHGDYKVFFNTYIWPDFEDDECCELKVVCPGNTCNLVIIGNIGHRLCFGARKSYQLQISFTRARNKATDIALMWSCSSHIASSNLKSGDFFMNGPLSFREFDSADISGAQNSSDNEPEDKWRVVPVGVLFSTGAPGESEPVVVHPSSMTVEGENSIFEVCLPKKPKANVTVSFEGPCSFDKCSCSFGEEDWDIPQKVSVSPCKDTVINGEPQKITMTCSSEDDEFDEIDFHLGCSFGSENVEPRKSMCHVNFNGYMFNSWDEFEYSQGLLKSVTGCFDIFSGSSVLKVQGYLADCGTSTCLIGVSIVSGGEVIKFYKRQGDDYFSLDWRQSASQSDIVVEDWEGCWKVTTPDASIITVCQNYYFLEVNILFNELYTENFNKNVSAYGGLCFSNTYNGTENALEIASSIALNSFLQRSEATQQKVSKRCGVEPESVIIERGDEGGAMMKTVSFDAAYKTDYFVPLKVSDLDKGFFGTISREKLDIDRERLCSEWNEFLPSLELEAEFSVSCYKRFMYFYQKMRVTCDLVDSFVLSYLDINPLFCLLGKCNMMQGCTQCDFQGCNPPLPGPTAPETQLSDRCTNSYSVIVSPATGRVIKCFEGMCEWSPNGFTWEGLPTHVDYTPYCLTAISGDFSTIWGWTAVGTKIFSNDFGQSWLSGVYTADEKEVFNYAHVDPYLGGSVGIKGNSHSVPDSDLVFTGFGEDKWWFTDVELCVSSNRLTSGKAMIYCVQWWCECLDIDQWGAAFGVDVLIGVEDVTSS